MVKNELGRYSITDKIYSRGQSISLQIVKEVEVSGSCIPSPRAIVEFLVLNLNPFPHVALQVDHDDHSFHTESTKYGTETKEQKSISSIIQ